MISISILRNVFTLICRQILVAECNMLSTLRDIQMLSSAGTAHRLIYITVNAYWGTAVGLLLLPIAWQPNKVFTPKHLSVNTTVTKAWSYTATAPHAFIVQCVTENREYFIPSLEPTWTTRSRVPPEKLEFVHLQEITSIPKPTATFTTSTLRSLTQNTESTSYLTIPLL